MTLTLDLPPEVEALLQESAAGAATTPEAYALEALRVRLQEEAEDAADIDAARRAEEAARAAGEKPIPLAEALALNERERLAR